jgi:hypothetical protein
VRIAPGWLSGRDAALTSSVRCSTCVESSNLRCCVHSPYNQGTRLARRKAWWIGMAKGVCEVSLLRNARVPRCFERGQHADFDHSSVGGSRLSPLWRDAGNEVAERRSHVCRRCTATVRVRSLRCDADGASATPGSASRRVSRPASDKTFGALGPYVVVLPERRSSSAN